MASLLSLFVILFFCCLLFVFVVCVYLLDLFGYYFDVFVSTDCLLCIIWVSVLVFVLCLRLAWCFMVLDCWAGVFAVCF